MNAQTFSHGILKTRNLIYLLLIALLLSACGSCPKPTQQLPDGAYTTTVMVEDMANIGMPPARSCENAGTFTLTVTGNKWSFFQIAAPGCIVKNPSWSGTWKFCGNEATFTESGSRYTYKWAFDGAELRFTRVDDTTATRIVWMTNYPWVLQK
jgi:uncharacterized protein YceK